jgi:preprotein translocase subunit SecF
LLEDGIRVELSGEGEAARARVMLLLDEPHSTQSIAATLGKRAQLSGATVEEDPARANAYVATLDASKLGEASPQQIHQSVKDLLATEVDANGDAYNPALGIQSLTSVGPQVVGDLRDKALLALVLSLFATVLYVRVRFAEYSYGIAAVAALIHDVLTTLAALTIANHFGIVNGEISLPIIALFLTIIGYSVNDTIVIFDRVRENLPRMQESLEVVLNKSLNETLSRTIMTSVTVMLATVVLYVFNFGTGNVLESFAFGMMWGVVTGVYSTIYVANPILVWLEKRGGRVSQGLRHKDVVERGPEDEDEAQMKALGQA